ncbi:MAG: 3-dehydroquinate synthase [Clostridia bacterium]|nr:3-dehydroquinate synthase [Clostridia bacterium]
MTTVKVHASRDYDVIIGSGLLCDAGKYLKDFCPNKTAAVITDDIVDGLYYKTLERSLTENGITAIKYVIENGEKSKNAENFIGILNFLASNHFTRTDTVIALGGGVVGDLAGFAAACYLRGIGFVQIPTTLLAMVDSSVGGKTAIDLDSGKNLAGAFYQPQVVLCDYSALDTLPEDVFSDGCAEVIKYAVLGDEKLFEHLTLRGRDFDREQVIAACVGMKRDIVGEDEFDRGMRQLLNLGHTLGHAIELCSSYAIPHGKAVAAGMATVAAAAAENGVCSDECAQKINDIVVRFSLPTDTEFDGAQLYDAMLSDKKRSGGTITLVVPEKIGKCGLKKLDLTELAKFFGFDVNAQN